MASTIATNLSNAATQAASKWTVGDATTGCKYTAFSDSNWGTYKAAITTTATVANYDGYFFAATCDILTT